MTEAAGAPLDDGSLVRGSTLLLSAKLVAVLGGFALYWFLALAFTFSLGDVAGTAALGTWGATFGVINPLNTMAAAGTLQMMSRLVASRGAVGGAVFGRAARTQFALVLCVFAALELSAGTIARFVLHDASYAGYLRLAALIPVCYSLRALYEGYLNGTRRFREQALLDMGSTLLRLVCVLAGAAVGYGAFGAIGGFVVAAAGMAAIAFLWVRPRDVASGEPPSVREIVAFQAQVIGVTLATQYLLNSDLLAVKAYASVDPAVADRFAGYYTAAQKLAQVPLSMVVALAYVMFSYVASDHARAREIVRSGMRALLLLMAPAAALIAANAHETLSLVFPTVQRTLVAAGDPPGVASGALAVLVLGYVPCAMFLTSSTLITASGRPGLAAGIAGLTLAAAWLALRILTPAYGPPGAALGVSLAWTLGLCGAGAALTARLGLPLRPASALRILAAATVVGALARAIQTRGALLLVEYLVLGGCFVGVLLLAGELRASELRDALRRLRP